MMIKKILPKLFTACCAGLIGLFLVGGWFWMHPDQAARLKKGLGQRVPEMLKAPFRDPVYQELMATLSTEDHFHTMWDFDDEVLLSRHLFVPTEMYGHTKYRYKPNIRIHNLSVWTGLGWSKLIFASTPEIEAILKRCRLSLDVVFETDAHGFKETPSFHGAHPQTVFFLGDSFTEGMRVLPHETFVSLVDQKLNEASIDVQAFNLGVNGYSALEMSWMLEQYAPILKPHLIVLNLFPNDVHTQYPYVIRGEHIPEKNYETLFFYLDRMTRYCETSGMEMVVVLIPDIEQFFTLKGFSVFEDRVEAWGKERGVRVWNPKDYFEAVGPKEIYFSDDPHFSPLGHQHYAEFLYQKILKQHLLTPSHFEWDLALSH